MPAIKPIATLLLACSCLLFSTHVEASSTGRYGEAYRKEGVLWQPVRHEDGDTEMRAAMPGSPRTLFMNNVVAISSKVDGIWYELHWDHQSRFAPPKTEKEFLEVLRAVMPKGCQLQALSNRPKNTLYLVETEMQDRIARVYCTRNMLYWAIIETSDKKKADAFFETIEIVR